MSSAPGPPEASAPHRPHGSADEVDTIVALATPPGRGGIGVVRLSGPASRRVALALLGVVPPPRHAHYGSFRDAAGAVLDWGIALLFAAPASYTGEDVLELQGHGGPVVMQRLVTVCTAQGCRLARPGEFSERAFLNGRMDLAQAEAIADLIDATSEQAARAAVNTLQGAFSERVRELMAGLTAVRVQIEAAIDFPDEQIDPIVADEVAGALGLLAERLQRLMADAGNGSRLRRGLHAVLLGRPNVGKSSLLNRLSRQPAAIVSDIPGTTRDLLRESVILAGVQVELTDTAGLRRSAGAIEQEGMRRARDAAARADLTLLMSEPGRLDEDLALLTDAPAGPGRLLLIENKIDLQGLSPVVREHRGFPVISLSARTGAGLDLLERHIAAAAGAQTAEAPFVARLRHLEALASCGESLEAARRSQAAGLELTAEELRRAQQALGQILGEVTSDDLLGEIFSNFCIGK